MSDAKGINVLAICGSLRAGSYNRAALRTAIELRPPGMTIETADISTFPLYNEDVRAQGFPPPVETLRRQTGGDHGGGGRDGGLGAGAIRSAAQLRLSRHAPLEQARGADRPGPDQVRRRRPPYRRGW